jgi:hypothetical protein
VSQALRDAAKELKGMVMEVDPGGQRLVEDEFNVLVATVGQRHDECPGLAERAARRVKHASGIAKVKLRFRTGRALDAHRGGRPTWCKMLEEAVDRG